MIVKFNIKLALYINTMVIFACNGNFSQATNAAKAAPQKSRKRDCTK